MKKNLLTISFSGLLLASPGILSQTADRQNAQLANPSSASEPSADKNTQDELLLAKASINSVIDKNSAVVEHKKEKTPVDEAALVSTDTAKTGIVKRETVDTEHSSDEEIAHQRQLFLKAEIALKNNKQSDYFSLSDQLKDYPLYPYLRYQWLIKHIDQEKQVKQFLEQHGSSRYSRILKQKWLHHLARKKQWPLFLEYYNASSNTKLNCYYHIAQLHTGDKKAALEGAKELWSVGHSQPSECDPLFAQLKKSGLFTQDLLWQRFDAALRNNKTSLAAYVKKQMPQEHQPTAQLWLNLHKKPSRYIPQLLDGKQTADEAALAPLMFSHAINRLARKDVSAAIDIWDANKDRFNIEKAQADKLEKRLAFKLVYEKDSAAYERLSQLDETDSSSRTWRVRVALFEQNWQNVIAAIAGLNEDEKQEERWQYWLARAYMETDKVDWAQLLLSELSKNRSFYGYLAADKVNSMYQLSNNPVDVTAEEIAELKNRQEFRVAFELMVLDRKNDAKLQWWHAVRSLDKKEILVAAKLAQQWQWDEIAIFTIAKAKYWDDIEVRFPLSYTDKIHENSELNNLNPVIIYGLIRRESAFNEKATSPTGARGLMQIMPRTGRDIARRLNERWKGSNSLYNPATNLKYGSYYYQNLLDRFDGHYAIALAAYNAGPDRVKKWLPETGAMPADIWIETIPYKETREYVTSVLAYALIYQQRTQSDELSMNDFIQDITPLDSSL